MWRHTIFLKKIKKKSLNKSRQLSTRQNLDKDIKYYNFKFHLKIITTDLCNGAAQPVYHKEIIFLMYKCMQIVHRKQQ